MRSLAGRRRRIVKRATALAGVGADDPFIQLTGVVGNYISSVDRTEYDIDQAISLRVKVALDDWTAPAARYTLLSKWDGLNTQRSYMFAINTTGNLEFFQSPDGTLQNLATSTVAVPFANGAIRWVRADWSGTNGLVKFYRSVDGVAWTQMGSNVSAVWANTFNGTASLDLGANNNGNQNPLNGRLYEAIVKDGGADLSVLTDVFHADLALAEDKGDGGTFLEKIHNQICTIHVP